MQKTKRKRQLSHEQQLGIAILLSLLLHLLLLIFSLVPWRVLIPGLPNISEASERPPKKIQPEKTQRLEFELVQTPDDALQPEKPAETPYVSDKNALARDMYEKNDLPLGDAYADGNFDVSTYARGSQQQPAPPVAPQPQVQPQEQAKQTPEKKRQNEVEESKSRTNTYLQRIRPSNEDARRAAFLSQFRASADHRPLRRDNPLREQKKTRAQNFGGFTLNTYNWNWAPYLLAMQEKIDRNLFPPAAFTRLGVISGETRVRFRVFPDGHVANIQVLAYEGHSALMETSVNSIKVSDPFAPLPEDFPREKEYLEVTAKFQFLVPR